MARTAEKVRALVENEPGMRDAIETVVERAADDGGTVEWADVEDDLTSGQWGRLIEKGILKSDSGDGFRVVDIEAIEGVLSGDDVQTAELDEEGSSWTTYDKIAGLGALGLFLGYSVGPVRDAVGSTLNVVLGPLDAALPFYAVVLVLAMATGLYSTLLQANLMNTEKMGAYQQRMKDIQARMKEAQESGNDAEVERIRDEQMEAMGDQMGMFKEQFRPMVWIMLLTIPAFLWLYWKVLPNSPGVIADAESTIVLPLAGSVNWLDTILVFPAWIAWYFVCSLGFTQVIRKALNVNTTPTAS